MRPADKPVAKDIKQKLSSFKENLHPLPGIEPKANLETFLHQLIDSIRRVRYVETIRDKRIDQVCKDARSVAFDPIKAASWHRRFGDLDEAYWLVFLSTHFGKNKKSKWSLAAAVYGAFEHSVYWSWEAVYSDPDGFVTWLENNQEQLRLRGSFGNHRKYESLKSSGTGRTVRSYVEWVGPSHNHQEKINEASEGVDDDPLRMFNTLYNNMRTVHRFGRTARFDYLSMLGKLSLAPIEPDRTYMTGATGPLDGARLLFAEDPKANLGLEDIEDLLQALYEHLKLPFGMQILEDALCNWQKSPNTYRYFGG